MGYFEKTDSEDSHVVRIVINRCPAQPILELAQIRHHAVPFTVVHVLRRVVGAPFARRQRNVCAGRVRPCGITVMLRASTAPSREDVYLQVRI